MYGARSENSKIPGPPLKIYILLHRAPPADPTLPQTVRLGPGLRKIPRTSPFVRFVRHCKEKIEQKVCNTDICTTYGESTTTVLACYG